MGVLIQLDIVFTWLTFPPKLHPYAIRNHTNTLREIRILEESIANVLLSCRPDAGKQAQAFPLKTLQSGESTWWRFLEMGSSGGENRWSRACYATLRDYLGTGANSGVPSRRVASRIVWTVLLISLEPNHVT